MAGTAGNLSLSDGATPDRSHNCGSVGSVHLRNLLVGEALPQTVSDHSNEGYLGIAAERRNIYSNSSPSCPFIRIEQNAPHLAQFEGKTNEAEFYKYFVPTARPSDLPIAWILLRQSRR